MRVVQGERGQALVLVVMVMGMVLAVGAVMVDMGNRGLMRTRADRTSEALTNAARLGLAQGKMLVWDRYVHQRTLARGSARQGGSVTGSLDDYRRYWAQLLLSGSAAGGNDGVLLSTMRKRGRPVIGGLRARGQDIEVEVRGERVDLGTRTGLVILRATARLADAPPGQEAERVIEQVLRIGTGTFQGFDFALLANAVNCTFCHADFDNVRRVHNSDPTRYGTFPRIKVATLESLQMREYSTTNIAGTLYVQGALIDDEGTGIDPLHWTFTGEGWDRHDRPAHGLRTVELDQNGNIVEDSSGEVTVADFAEAGVDADGAYIERNATFYRNYDTTTQVDGFVPTHFPPVVPDLGDDPDRPQTPRIIDDAEWAAHTASFVGTITGGARVLVDARGGETYGDPSTNTTLPDPDTSPASGVFDTQQANRSVILVGTESNPIVIDGDVAIDGDVVISGVVQGEGHLLARRNLYVVGDLRYNDGVDSNGNRTFGVDPLGGTNNVAYAAGGLISHGAYMAGTTYEYDVIVDGDASDAPEWERDPDDNDSLVIGPHGDPVRTDSPWDDGAQSQGNMALQQIGWWNRMEYTRAMPYFDPVLDMPTPNESGPDGPNPANVAYVEGYTPRFYTFREGGEVWLFGPNNQFQDYHNDPTQPIRWNNGGPDGDGPGYWMGDGDDFTYAKSITLRDFLNEYTDRHGADDVRDYLLGNDIVRMPLHPQNEWITPEQFLAIFSNTHAERFAANGDQDVPFQLDGLFYTANGMLATSKSNEGLNPAWQDPSMWPNEGAGGEIVINGSLVAADTGILAHRHLQVNYDVRTQQHLTVHEQGTLEIFSVAEREHP